MNDHEKLRLCPLAFASGFLGKDVVEDIHDVQLVFDGALQIVVDDLKGVAHFEGFQVFFEPVIQNLTHTLLPLPLHRRQTSWVAGWENQ